MLVNMECIGHIKCQTNGISLERNSMRKIPKAFVRVMYTNRGYFHRTTVRPPRTPKEGHLYFRTAGGGMRSVISFYRNLAGRPHYYLHGAVDWRPIYMKRRI